MPVQKSLTKAGPSKAILAPKALIVARRALLLADLHAAVGILIGDRGMEAEEDPKRILP